MDPTEVTRQIVEAWDEIVAEEDAALDDGTVEPEAPAEEEPEPDEDDGEEEPAEDEEPDESDESDDADDEEEEEAEPEQDIEIKAFLAKYDGDVDAALKGAAELAAVLGRQGLENGKLKQEIEQQRAENERLRLVNSGAPPLTQEQREWVEEAISSGQPAAFVQAAVDAREWELAKALCGVWGQDDPFNAGRIAAQVERREYEDQNQPAEPVNLTFLVQAMQKNDPSMLPYARHAAEMIDRLGPEHRIIKGLESGDFESMVQAVQEVYDLARFSSVAVTEARQRVKATERENGASAKRDGVVTSAEATPSSSETPRRSRMLMPGLTIEALEEAFEASQ